jgi:uncharacterized protein (DUF302 family)
MSQGINKDTEQYILNKSYDDTYEQLAVEIVEELNGALVRKQSDPFDGYKTQALDDYTTTNVTYVCKMKADGTWLFTKIDETGNFPTFTYANVSNNATLTDYATAYAARTTATYGLLNTLTF